MKKIEMIDIKVEAKINITFGTIGGETFKFFFTTVDKKIAERAAGVSDHVWEVEELIR